MGALCVGEGRGGDEVVNASYKGRRGRSENLSVGRYIIEVMKGWMYVGGGGVKAGEELVTHKTAQWCTEFKS